MASEDDTFNKLRQPSYDELRNRHLGSEITPTILKENNWTDKEYIDAFFENNAHWIDASEKENFTETWNRLFYERR